MSLRHDYSELITMTKNYLQENHALTEFVPWRYSPKPVEAAPKAPPEKKIFQPTQDIVYKKPPLETAPKPEPQQVQVKKETKPKITTFALENIEPEKKPSFADLFDFHKNIPSIALRETIPEEFYHKFEPRQNKQKIEIALLIFNEAKADYHFLENVARALSLRFERQAVVVPASTFIEDGLTQSSLKLVIASDYGIYSLPALMKHFKESSIPGKYHLGQASLMLLPDLGLYRREPKLKSSLWKALCQECLLLK